MIQAKLFLLKQEIELLWTDMQYVRELKPGGKPGSGVLGGEITVCFATRIDTDLILRWLTKKSEDETQREADKMEEGEILFYHEGFDNPATKSYKFNDAFPIHYREIFSANDKDPLQTILTISPAIQNYGSELIKPWNISFVPPSEDAPYQSKETTSDMKIMDVYYEDMDGNKIRDLKVGMDVYLVIVSQNIIGKAVNANLSDKNCDFMHNGGRLENDLLNNLIINDDLHKEKLTVIADHSLEETAEEEESSTVTIRLTRKWETTESTIGEFTIDDSDVTGFMLEEKGPDTTVSGQEQRVPVGTYNLEWHSGTKFKKALKLYNSQVSKARAILIHGGNTASDTEGCLLPGTTRSTNFVGSSQAKLKEIFKVVEDKGIEGAQIIITAAYE